MGIETYWGSVYGRPSLKNHTNFGVCKQVILRDFGTKLFCRPANMQDVVVVSYGGHIGVTTRDFVQFNFKAKDIPLQYSKMYTFTIL